MPRAESALISSGENSKPSFDDAMKTPQKKSISYFDFRFPDAGSAVRLAGISWICAGMSSGSLSVAVTFQRPVFST